MINQPLLSKIINDRDLRKAVARESHRWFFSLYLPNYAQYPIAPFQEEMFAISEDPKSKLVVITAFRGSAKSTIMTMSYPIWAILGKLQKKFVLIVSRTQNQAQTHLNNIKQELDRNDLLRSELGPFRQENGTWGASKLVINKFGAAIMQVSMEQSIRGIRYMQHRPDLIICDDIEDLGSVRTLDSRDKTFQWLTREILLTGDTDTKIVIVGNRLHDDSVLMRLKDKIENKKLAGIYYSYPLLDGKDKIAWPGKFPDTKAIKKLRDNTVDEIAWQREYLLKMIPEDGQIVSPDWINYYDKLPPYKDSDFRFTGVGVDLALSPEERADCTAMVIGQIYGSGNNMKIFILPDFINRQIEFPETTDLIKVLNRSLSVSNYGPPHFYVETVGYQQALVQSLQHDGISVEGINPGGIGKRARLISITPLIKSKTVLFPRKSDRVLINQMVNFGIERHDDLVDALVYLCLAAIKQNKNQPNIRILN